ncbi:hypothetical protein GCM10010469_45950 [Streptomyces labedae]|uniref:Uncharacterized protein n=2 Tax=Streptomyces TaxID=1883 RepID=A0ABQ2U7M3_9ACTN|nr:hypothetical protein GCM10010265_07760 [Streptomyces griseoincarnatus]GGT71668.1 hypothetical protein GCM10010287_52680 [Streptomyces variabilis]
MTSGHEPYALQATRPTACPAEEAKRPRPAIGPTDTDLFCPDRPPTASVDGRGTPRDPDDVRMLERIIPVPESHSIM